MKYMDRFALTVHELIANNQAVCISSIARKMGVSRQAIYYHLDKFKDRK